MSDIADDVASIAGSVAETTPGSARKKRRRSDAGEGNSTYIDNLRQEKEQLTLDKIVEFLTGKPETADLVLFQLESGKHVCE